MLGAISTSNFALTTGSGALAVLSTSLDAESTGEVNSLMDYLFSEISNIRASVEGPRDYDAIARNKEMSAFFKERLNVHKNYSDKPLAKGEAAHNAFVDTVKEFRYAFGKDGFTVETALGDGSVKKTDIGAITAADRFKGNARAIEHAFNTAAEKKITSMKSRPWAISSWMLSPAPLT